MGGVSASGGSTALFFSMSESWMLLILLAVLSASVVVATITLVLASRDLRRFLRGMHTLLPACTEAIQETQQMLGETRKVLMHTKGVTADIEAVVHRACASALELIEQVDTWSGKARTLFGERVRNGAGSGPRQRRRGV